MSFFKSNNDSSDKRHAGHAVTILTAGCHFDGKLYCKGSSRIGGKINGELISEGLLVLEDTSVVEADVKSEDVILHGKFTGKLQASGKVEICKNASFDGELNTPTLLVHEGAKFNGTVKMSTKQDIGGFIGLEDLQKKKHKDTHLSEVSLPK